MTSTITINSDLGESFGLLSFGHDDELLDLIDAANIACGFHAGDPLVMLEAMKMLHTLAAPADGRVAELRCREGDSVRGGDVLVVVEPEEKT